MYKNATKCNETIGKWCKNKHGASKIIDTFETYQRAIDAFIVGLRQGDPVEEMGRIKPKIVSDLMDVANRFADGEDVCNNKRT
jgi:hypothetical protein